MLEKLLRVVSRPTFNAWHFVINKLTRLVAVLRLGWLSRYLSLAAILVVGTALRFINIRNQPFWGDEVYGVAIVRHFPELRDLLQYLWYVDYYPPVSFTLLHYWSQWFGFSEFALRLPSVAFGVLAIYLTYALGCRLLKSESIGVLAALIVALLPIQIHFSQSVRPYIIYQAFGLLALYWYWRYREGGARRYLLLYCLAAILGLYTHYSFVYIFAPLVVFWLYDILRGSITTRRQSLIDWFGVHVLIFLSFVPWLPAFLSKFYLRGQAIYGMVAMPIPVARVVSFFDITFGQLVWLTKLEPVTQVEVFAIGIFKAVCVAAFLALCLRRGPAVLSYLREFSSALMLLVWLAVSILVIFLWTPLSTPYTPITQQHIIMVTVVYALLFAAVLQQFSFRLRLLVLVLFLVSLVTFVANTVGDDSESDAQYRLGDVADFINTNYKQGDMVIVGYNILRTDLNYYLRPELSAVGFAPITFHGNDYLATRDTMGISEVEFHFRLQGPTRVETFQRLDQLVDQYEPKRIGFAYFFWPERADEWMHAHGWRKVFNSFHKLLPVALYERPQQPVEPQ
jgi:uncharacterized membrane protein